MDKGEWGKILRLMGIVYLPIVMLIIFVFILVQCQSRQ
jgi:hypothetical protein